MNTIDLSKKYKIQQIENTTKEIKKMQEFSTQITLEEMQQRLSEIGLRLDLNPNSYALYYYNSSNENHWFELSTSPIDSKCISAYNVQSDFYNKHLKGWHDETGRKLDELRFNFFCTITKNGIEYIVSF